MKNIWIAYHMLIVTLIRFAVVDSLTISLEEIIQTYDSTARPKLRGSVNVNISLLINSLEIEDKRQMLKLSGELQQEWDDIHLRFSSAPRQQSAVGLQGERGNRIKQHLWLPDITIANGVNAFIPPGGDFLLIDGDGHIIWIQQIHYEFPCSFDFSSFPVGTQDCKLKLQSIGYDINALEPRWAGESSVYHSGAVVTLRYKIKKVSTASATVVSIHRAKRQLQATLQLELKSGWSIKHTVLPFVATVTTAYLAFFINIRGIIARTTLCSVSFLTACIFHESTYSKIPQSPYTMAIEIFTGTCLTFIWLALLETVIVDVLSHLPKRSPPASAHNSYTTEHSEMVEGGGSTRGQIAALWLDRCFRVLYPAAFLSFNAVFWILYH